MTGVRILAVDWLLDHPDIRREGFFDPSAFSAHGAVCIDPDRISSHWLNDVSPHGDGVRRTDPQRDRGFGRTLASWMSRRRCETEDLLVRGGGLLVCRLRPRGVALEVGSPGAPSERLDRYSWLPSVSLVDRHHQLTFPSNSRFLARRGRDVVIEDADSPFSAYLQEFAGRIVYEAVYQDLLSTPIERFATVLARNRVGDILALEVPFDDGRLILLPPVEGVSPTREADVLLDAVRQADAQPGFVASPDWLPAYVLEGEEALVDELAGLTERRKTLSAKIDEVSEKLDRKSRHKRMLYAKGRSSLQSAVSEGFEVLGFQIESNAESLLLKSDEGDALVVCAATEDAAIDLPPYRRLLAAIDRAVTDGDEHRKGILVVNGSRELDPKRRPTQYADEVLRGCTSQRFCLLTTYQLFKLVRKASASKDKRTIAAMRRTLLESEGPFRDSSAS